MPEQILIFVDRLDNGAEEQQELRVFVRRVAGLEKVDARIGGDRPVVVLAAAVDAGERLFVQQADKSVPCRDLLHDFHGELVVVGGDVGGGEDGRELVLSGRDLVVLGLGENAELPQLLVEICHERRDARLDRAEVMVVHLLSLGRLCAEKRAPAEHKVLALIVHALCPRGNIPARGRRRYGRIFTSVVAEELQHAQRLLVERLHRTQQRRFLIERLAAVGAERRRDAERFVLYKGVGGRVPGGVAARLKGGAKPAGRESWKRPARP